MKTKLTLSVDKDLVKYARKQAKYKSKSISSLFSDYILSQKLHRESKASSSINSMVGSLKSFNIDDSKTATRTAYAKKYTN